MTARASSLHMNTGSDVGIAATAASLGALVTGFFAWLIQRAKGGTDIEAVVIAEWKALFGGVSDRLATVEREFTEYRMKVSKQFEEMREQHAREKEDLRRKHEAEMHAQRELNEGLQRQIAQNSQSSAHMLSRSPVTQVRDEPDES
jgi:Skp family chaperone for outer membrane proteins